MDCELKFTSDVMFLDRMTWFEYWDFLHLNTLRNDYPNKTLNNFRYLTFTGSEEELSSFLIEHPEFTLHEEIMDNKKEFFNKLLNSTTYVLDYDNWPNNDLLRDLLTGIYNKSDGHIGFNDAKFGNIFYSIIHKIGIGISTIDSKETIILYSNMSDEEFFLFIIKHGL